MRKNIKRVIAGVLSAVLSLSLVNFSALSVSFASELSGYEIGVEYSEDNTSATLVGNTTGVKEGVQLDKLVDSEGQELDPASFSQTVEENGTYHFTLYYQEAVDTQGADQPTTEEKTQKLEVVVNGIVELESQEAPAGETGAEQEQPATEMPTLPTGDPATAGSVVPVNVLMRSAAQSRASTRVQIYAYEVDYKLSDIDFSGGALVKGAEGLPAVDYRTFEYAGFVRGNGTSVFRITGLYNYNNKWYYTVDKPDSVQGFEDMGVGFQLPSDATVRLYYSIPNDAQKHMLTFNGGNASLTGDYNLTVNGGPDHIWLMYAQGTKIIIEFDLPPRFDYVRVQIPEVGFDGTTRDAAGEDAALQENRIKKVSEFRYTLMFTVPNQAVNINFTGTDWPDTAEYSVCLGTGAGTPQAGEQVIDTYFKTTGGTTREALVAHWPGDSGGKIDHYNWRSLPISGGQTDDFSEGKYRAGSTLTLDLKMNRWYDAFGGNPYYTWRPTVLVLQVYLGTTFGGDQFKQYYIPLQPWWGGQTDMTLDFGARVIAECTEWENQKYRYTITIENMYHNFAIYDSPVTTNNQNFMVVNTSGIDMSASTIEEKDGEKPIALWSTYLGSNVKWSGSMNYYTIPMKGYTAPTFTVENTLSTATYYDRGLTSYKNNRYWLEIVVNNTGNPGYTPRDENKAPARISITAQPLTFTVNYYYNERVYHETGVALSVDQSTNYSIQYIYPDGMSNIKGYYIEVYEGANKIRTITKSDGSLWMPNQDVINYDYIYDQLKNNGQLPKRAGCELRVVAAPGDTTQGYVTAKYAIKLQNQYADLDTNGNQWLPDDKYTPKEGTVNAYVGNWVDLIGIPDTPVVDGKLYKRIGNAGQSGGQVTGEGSIVGTLEYALATKVEVGTQTLGSDTNYKTWVTEETGSVLISKCYTSVNNLNHVMDWSGLTPGTQDGQVFNGWALKGKNGTTVSLGNVTSANLYTIFQGGKNSNLWSEIFDNGTCTLVAMWRSAIEPIKNTQGDTSLVTNNPVYVVANDTTGFEISAVFKYGTKTVVENNAGADQVARSEIQSKITSGDIKLVVLKKPGNAGTAADPWQLWYSENRAQDNSGSPFPIGSPVISVDASSGGFKVTFKVKENSAINLEYEKGAVYRIFAWSEANGNDSHDLSSLTGSGLQTEMNDNNEAKLALIPCVKTDVKELQKVTLADGTLKNQDGGVVYFVDSQSDSLSITGEFKYGDGTAERDEIEQMFDSGALKIALVKKNPSGGAWQVRFGPGIQISDGFGGPAITQGETAETFKITFTVEGPISAEWNDGASFRIFAWTNFNEGTTDLTAAQIASALTAADAAVTEEAPYKNPYEGQIPSVNVQSTMLRKVTLPEGNITDFPNPNVYIVNGASSFQITAEFKYGDGTATEKGLQKLFTDGALKIALLKKNPPSKGDQWQVRFGPGSETTAGFSEPTITKEDNSSNFKITFTVSVNVTAEWNERANFKIFAWTAAHEDMANLNVTQIAQALSDAEDVTPYVNPYEDKVPSVNTMTMMLYQVKDENNSIGSVEAKPVEGNEGGPLTLEADFRYEDSTADQKKLQDLFDAGELHIALLKIEPDKKPTVEGYEVSWHDVPYGGSSSVPKPTITKGEDANNFTVSFPVSKALNGWDDDGARFRIYVWTDANAVNTDGTSITTTQIADDLNSMEGGAEPVITKLPWVHYNLTLLYKVVNNGNDTSKTVSVLSTATSIQLIGTFKYNYNTDRYFWEQFTAKMLNDLIAAGKFNVTIEITKKDGAGSETKTLTPEEVIASSSADAQGNGIINFTYDFQDSTGTDLSAYDGATFKVKMSTKANVNGDIPAYTITVNYVSDPSAYVNIPKYIILEDDKSNVVENGNKQDGYAGKKDQVSYKEGTPGGLKPEITVKVQDGVLLREGSINGEEVQGMGIGIYTEKGVKIPAASDGYSTIGTLSSTNTSLPFYMNVKRGNAMKNQQYYATVMFMLELAGTMT